MRSYQDALAAIAGFDADQAEAEDRAKRKRAEAGLLQASDDFATALSGGGYKGTDVAGPMREEAKAIESRPLSRLGAAEKVRSLGASANRSNAASEESARARARLKSVAPEFVARMGPMFERMTAEELDKFLPEADAFQRVQASEAETAKRHADAVTRAANLRDIISKRYPDVARVLPLENYDDKALERLMMSADAETRQKTGQTFQATQGDLNRETTLAGAGVAAGAKQGEAALKAASELEGLAGPAGSIPQAGRAPSPKDADAFASAWDLNSRLETGMRRLKQLVDTYGPTAIMTDPALRGEALPLISDLQLNAKGPQMYQLGALSGPDMNMMASVVPNAATPLEALKELAGQSDVSAKLGQGLESASNVFRLAKERYGFTMPGDAGYERAKAEYAAKLAPLKRAREGAGFTWIQAYEGGRPKGGPRRFPNEQAEKLLLDPSRFRRAGAP